MYMNYFEYRFWIGRNLGVNECKAAELAAEKV